MLRVKKIDGQDCLHLKSAFLAMNGNNEADAQRLFDESELEVYPNGYGDKAQVIAECERLFGGQPTIMGAKRSREDEEDLQSTCKVIETLAKTYKILKGCDESLEQRILLQLCNQQRHLECLCNSEQEDRDPAIYATTRIKALYPDAEFSDAQLFEIGKLASRYYYCYYGMYPPKVPRYIQGKTVLVNKYTQATAPHSLDLAIEDVLGIENDE